MSGSKIRLYGSTSGYVELEAPAVGDDGVLSLPTAADGFGAAGIGTNVVQTAKTDTFTTTSTTFVTVTGLTVSITPTSATSKILIIAQISAGFDSASRSMGLYKVTRGGTDIYIGDSASNRTRAIFGGYLDIDNRYHILSNSIVYLDSPATTSSVTYQVEASKESALGSVFVNRSGSDGDFDSNARGASSITAIEVAA